MAASQPDAYARAVHRFATAGKLGSASNMLNWDAQTHMPPGGAWARGEQMAAITEVSADLVGSRAICGDRADNSPLSPAAAPGWASQVDRSGRPGLNVVSPSAT